MINGEYIETNYLDPTTLLISGHVFENMDKICVVQRSNSSTRKALSGTRQRYYSVLKQGKQ